MKDIITYLFESQNKKLQNAFDILKKVFNVKPEYSEDGRY